MAEMRPAAEMKDSGTRYLSMVPVNWSVRKLKRHLRREEPKNPGDVPVLSLYRELGIVLKDSRDDNHNVTSEDTSNYKYVQVGDFVVNKMKAWQGSVAVSDYEGIVSPAYYVYHFKDNAFIKRYFHYLLRGCYKDEFMSLSGGIRPGQWDLPSTELDNIMILVPPLVEQQAIADYLDDRCSRIDEIIAEATASIEEYKELKQAVIFEAVTKGLDKDVPMKDSGVEWIGKMPSTWDAIRIKYLLSEVNNRSETGDEEPLSVSQVLGVVPSTMIAVANPASSTIGQKIVEPGNLVFNKLKAHLGVFFVSNYKGLVSPDYAVYRANERVNPKFLEYLFHTSVCITEFTKYITGVAVGLMRLYTSDLFNIYVALPVRSEQERIINHLDDSVHKYDALISEKQSLISDLQAYKKSLIYEVVTGKRRVV